MRAGELSDESARTVAWAMGIFRWRDRDELNALIDAWPCGIVDPVQPLTETHGRPIVAAHESPAGYVASLTMPDGRTYRVAAESLEQYSSVWKEIERLIVWASRAKVRAELERLIHRRRLA